MSRKTSSDYIPTVEEILSAQVPGPADQLADGQVHQAQDTAKTGDDNTNARIPTSQTPEQVKPTTQTAIEEPKGSEPVAPSPEVKPEAEDKGPPPPPAFIIQEVPHNIGDEDQLWKNANKLAKDLIEEQTKSMDGTLDTMLIFVSHGCLYAYTLGQDDEPALTGWFVLGCEHHRDHNIIASTLESRLFF